MLFDMFYVTDLGLRGYLFVYIPLAALVAWLSYRWVFRKPTRMGLRVALPLALFGFLLAAPVWDVYSIGKESKRLCREYAGLHVFRTVQAEGALVGPDIDTWSRYGYTYTESHGRGNRKFRYTVVDGKAHQQEIAEFSVRYRFIGGEDARLSRHHVRTVARTGDTETQEPLGEFVRILTYPGWLDGFFIRITGTGSRFRPWVCGKEPLPGHTRELSVTDLVRATIRPPTTRTREPEWSSRTVASTRGSRVSWAVENRPRSQRD